MFKYLFVFIYISFCSYSFSQAPKTHTSSEILLQLKKLKVLGSVLYVGAHPDDENNALLPYLAKEKLYRTAYLSLTRGEGGQNLIGDEQGIELGLMRTQELLAARRVDGAEQYFTRAYEFGYSKSATEALRFWDKEKILSDVVWVIRLYQPDIIINRFPPDVRAGHGHHAASAILSEEAFTAAADPNKFPEQFKYGVQPWQAKRILWNSYNEQFRYALGTNNNVRNNQLKIDIGGYNALLGKSYGELGAEARTMHKCQGEGRPRRRGPLVETFDLVAGDTLQQNLMDDINISWERIQDGKQIGAMIETVIANYKMEQPELSVPALVKIHQAIKLLSVNNWTKKKLAETQEIIEACSALFVEATSNKNNVVQGDSLQIFFFVNMRKGVNAILKNLKLRDFDTSVSKNISINNNIIVNKTLPISTNEKISQPYWLEHPQTGATFDVRNQLLIGKAENDPALEATFIVSIEGEDFTIKRPVLCKFTDPTRGDVYQPIPVLPGLEMNYMHDNFISMNGEPVKVQYHIKNNLNDSVDFFVNQYYSKYWVQALPAMADKIKDNKEKYFTETFEPLTNDISTQEEIRLIGMNDKQQYNNYTKTISYDHIPTITYFPQAKANLIKIPIKTIAKKIGYINGAGDKVPQALEAIGYEIKLLSETDITDDNLRQFNAIIVGVRAYNIHEWLTNKNDILNKYIYNGGNLIVQYLKSNQVGGKAIKAGPYPFSINFNRITEEDAKVSFLIPNHAALNYPNKITDKDFEGWVQERSTYQAEQLDSHFETPLGMHDTNEKETNGSLAIAKYGKGNFVYCSLVLFRQLPVGVSGAFRMLANLIALPKNK